MDSAIQQGDRHIHGENGIIGTSQVNAFYPAEINVNPRSQTEPGLIFEAQTVERYSGCRAVNGFDDGNCLRGQFGDSRWLAIC